MNAQDNLFDLSSLPVEDEPANAPAPAPASKPANGEPATDTDTVEGAVSSGPEKLVITAEMLLGGDFDFEEVIANVLEGNTILSVTRKGWSGVRAKSLDERVTGLRKLLKGNGFTITATVPDPSGKGRLASAVYASESGELVITYGTEPGYGHAIRSADSVRNE